MFHNSLLDNIINLLNKLLLKIIKNAHKIIVSDALINDGVFESLKYRCDDEKIFIINEYKNIKI